MGKNPRQHERRRLLGVAHLMRYQPRQAEIIEVIHTVEHEAPLWITIWDCLPLLKSAP